MKRLFIEIDEREDSHLETLSVLGALMHGLEETKTFFDTVIDDALLKVKDVWSAVLEHDEIYCSTALIPRFGFGSSLGSGTLFNSLMYKASEENIEGKKIFIFREYDSIRWDELKYELVDKAFRKNFLYVQSKNYEKWEQVDIDNLLKTKLYQDETD